MTSNQPIGKVFIVTGLLALIGGMTFGILSGFEYSNVSMLNNWLPFNKLRPLHVSLVIAWIFLAAVGGIYYYLPKITSKRFYFNKLPRIHWLLFIFTGGTILICYFNGLFGGREYLEFPPILSIPIVISWLLFILNYFTNVKKFKAPWPVYLWMWATGLVFFLFTILESYLWMIPYFRDNIVRDITVQWKALGAMVGSWNMLVYGTAFYVMEKISNDKKLALSSITFFFYFLGLTNLMFNWGHHTYIVPAKPWIKSISYIISMTELLIIGYIIYNWRKSISKAKQNYSLISYRLLSAADFWIFLNLTLAILISIPAINYYTHGTHITVAHAMGTTIGINTTILLSSAYFIFFNGSYDRNTFQQRLLINCGFWITQLSLAIFWVSLILAGIAKAMETAKDSAFHQIFSIISPYIHVFSIAGIGVLVGITMLCFPLLQQFVKEAKHERSTTI